MALPQNVSHKGFTLWFTGMSGAGKSTLSNALSQYFIAQNYKVEVLDGDEVRENLSKGLGFSKEDRDINVYRIGFVARLLSRNGVIAITAAISPYKDIRDNIRKQHIANNVPFIEVYAEATVDALAERDVKGLYKKALAGEIKNFTGISDPYEAPDNPEIRVRTDIESVDESVKKILDYLKQNELIAG